ncbi:MAG: phosphodiesterase [Gammaproteobacteria bacterium]
MRLPTLLLLVTWVSVPAAAAEYVVTGYEQIQIPLGAQGGVRAELPRPVRGMSEEAVLAQFGEPLSMTPPVGTPPISRWHYPDFTVYFEHHTVIHSVVRPAPGQTPAAR